MFICIKTAMPRTLLPNPIEGTFWEACWSLNEIIIPYFTPIMALSKRAENKPSNKTSSLRSRLIDYAINNRFNNGTMTLSQSLKDDSP